MFLYGKHLRVRVDTDDRRSVTEKGCSFGFELFKVTPFHSSHGGRPSKGEGEGILLPESRGGRITSQVACEVA